MLQRIGAALGVTFIYFTKINEAHVSGDGREIRRKSMPLPISAQNRAKG